MVPLWDHETGLMNVVSHKAIRTFCEKHRDAWTPLDRWYRVAKRATWFNFAEVKLAFNTADFVAPYVVFDVGGNKYRLIAEINFSRRLLFIRGIMTHKEYMKGAWKP
jgi:mRNA interferase HigB